MSFLTGIWGYVAPAILAALLAGAGVGWTVHRIDASVLSDLKASDAKARADAIQAASQALQKQDKAAMDAAIAEAQAQVKIVNHTVTLTKEIPVYVQDTSACSTPSVNLIRLLNAAATGADLTNIPTPAGQSSDPCSGLSWRSFASDIADDYGNGRANAEQLNALIASVKSIHDAALAPGK